MKPTKKKPARKPKQTPRVEVLFRYTFPFGEPLTKRRLEFIKAQAEGQAASAVLPALWLPLDEDVEAADIVRDGVIVRRTRTSR